MNNEYKTELREQIFIIGEKCEIRIAVRLYKLYEPTGYELTSWLNGVEELDTVCIDYENMITEEEILSAMESLISDNEQHIYTLVSKKNSRSECKEPPF